MHWLAQKKILAGTELGCYASVSLPIDSKCVDRAWLLIGAGMKNSSAYICNDISDANEGYPNASMTHAQECSRALRDIDVNDEVYTWYGAAYADCRLEVVAWAVPSMLGGKSEYQNWAEAQTFDVPYICQQLFNSHEGNETEILLAEVKAVFHRSEDAAQYADKFQQKLGESHNMSRQVLTKQVALFRFILKYDFAHDLLERVIGLMKACMVDRQHYSPLMINLITFNWGHFLSMLSPASTLKDQAKHSAKQLCQSMLEGTRPEITHKQGYFVKATLLMQRIHKLQRCIKFADHYEVQLSFAPQKELIRHFLHLAAIHIVNRDKNDRPELVWIHSQLFGAADEHGIWNDPALWCHFEAQ